MQKRVDHPRRRLLFLVPAAPIAALAYSRLAHAQDKPRLDPESEEAQRFQYVHDAEKASDERKQGAHCANCNHFHGAESDAWSSCNIFPEHRINANGWCSAWVGG